MQIKLQYCSAVLVILIFFSKCTANSSHTEIMLKPTIFPSVFWEILFWRKNEHQSTQSHAAGMHAMNYYFTDFVLPEPYKTVKVHTLQLLRTPLPIPHTTTIESSTDSRVG